MTPGATDARLQPDTSRRVILVSPAGLPEAVRYAEEFVVNIPAEAGLQRVRVQARRDARGGWITIADGKGTALACHARRASHSSAIPARAISPSKACASS